MILRAVFYTLIFLVVVVFTAVVFSTIYTTLDTSLDVLNESVPVDYRFRDTTFNYLRNFTWLIVLSAISVFIVYSVHTRRR
jgi:uncharacterized BrkB/YihY/UPF0761 family membrane protein